MNMPDPKISLLVPSRERLNLKLTLISSLISSCSDINNIELLFGTDLDDPCYNIIDKICRNTPFTCNIDIENNGKFIGINKIWNMLYPHARGNIIAYIGDDMAFMTQDWDLKIIDEFSGDNLPADGLKMVHCYDGYRTTDELCVNAFTTRTYYNITGYFTRPEFLINWSDQWMYQSYKAFNRVKYRRDIHIQHNHWVFGHREPDEVSNRMQGNLNTTDVKQYGNINTYSDKLWFDLRKDHHAEIEKIAKTLNLVPNWNVVD